MLAIWSEGQLFHVMKNQDHAQRSWNLQHGLMQEVMLFTVNRDLLRAVLTLEEKASELFWRLRHQLIQRQARAVALDAAAPDAMAAVSRDGVEPCGQRVWII